MGGKVIMAKINFLIQGLFTHPDHLDYIRLLLGLNPLDQCLISTAFVTADGVEAIKDLLYPIKDKVRIFIGVRNDITSKQAVKALLDIGINPICVDTATQAYLFHPKLYMASNSKKAFFIVGSANLTPNGLARNVEASITGWLDLADKNDLEQRDFMLSSFSMLQKEHNKNVYCITPETDLELLVSQGILNDESIGKPWGATRSKARSTDVESVPRMKLKTRGLYFRKEDNRTGAYYGETPQSPGSKIIVNEPYRNLIWKSRPLTRRALNIPDGVRTNVTGSMFLTKGAYERDIDFQHYFRDEAFSTEIWYQDPDNQSYDRVDVDFKFIIKGIDYGIYKLRVRHNTNYDSEAYRQRNSMTQIHWDNVRDIIRRPDLLGCTMRIYAPDVGEHVYTITIDE